MSVNYNIQDYYDGSDRREKGAFRISPSGINDFFDNKAQWFRENVLGEDRLFQGSSATLNGEIVHFCAEIVAECTLQEEEYSSEKLHKVVEEYLVNKEPNVLYDVDEVKLHWEDMGQALVRDFVIQANTLATERYMQHELLKGYYVGGTADAITSTIPNDDLFNPKGELTVRDYKTSSKKPSTFSWAYTLQAYAYAYMLRKEGINITQVELCFVTKPTKTLPVRTFSFKKPFGVKEEAIIGNILYLIAESVKCFRDYEDLQYLIAGDYRLKKGDIPEPKAAP